MDPTDSLVYPTMLALTTCLCDELVKEGRPTCFCGMLPGFETILEYVGGEDCDDGTCGQAWVRLIDGYPSTTFPLVETDASCAAFLAFTLEVGVARCAKVMEENGEPITVEEQMEQVRIQMLDMASIRRAIACCMSSTGVDYRLGSYQPISGGGASGGFWTVVVGETGT